MGNPGSSSSPIVIQEKVVVPTQLTRAQFIYAYSLITSLFFAWGFAYGLLDSLNKYVSTSKAEILPFLQRLSYLVKALSNCIWYHQDGVYFHAGLIFWLVFSNVEILLLFH